MTGAPQAVAQCRADSLYHSRSSCPIADFSLSTSTLALLQEVNKMKNYFHIHGCFFFLFPLWKWYAFKHDGAFKSQPYLSICKNNTQQYFKLTLPNACVVIFRTYTLISPTEVSKPLKERYKTMARTLLSIFLTSF